MVLGGCGPSTLLPVFTFTRVCMCPGLFRNPHAGPEGAASVSECGAPVVEGAPWVQGQVTGRASCPHGALGSGEPRTTWTVLNGETV